MVLYFYERIYKFKRKEKFAYRGLSVNRLIDYFDAYNTVNLEDVKDKLQEIFGMLKERLNQFHITGLFFTAETYPNLIRIFNTNSTKTTIEIYAGTIRIMHDALKWFRDHLKRNKIKMISTNKAYYSFGSDRFKRHIGLIGISLSILVIFLSTTWRYCVELFNILFTHGDITQPLIWTIINMFIFISIYWILIKKKSGSLELRGGEIKPPD